MITCHSWQPARAVMTTTFFDVLGKCMEKLQGHNTASEKHINSAQDLIVLHDVCHRLWQP